MQFFSTIMYPQGAGSKILKISKMSLGSNENFSCNGHATIVNNAGSCSCICHDGWTGTNCETRLPVATK